MATDNRHRPGPKFRCPERGCWSESVTIECEGAATRTAGPWRNAGGFWTRSRRTFICKCNRCGRRWRSRHKHARDQWDKTVASGVQL